VQSKPRAHHPRQVEDFAKEQIRAGTYRDGDARVRDPGEVRVRGFREVDEQVRPKVEDPVDVLSNPLARVERESPARRVRLPREFGGDVVPTEPFVVGPEEAVVSFYAAEDRLPAVYGLLDGLGIRYKVSSIRTSSPFEPLPPAFSGPYIELRFLYLYNIPVSEAQ